MLTGCIQPLSDAEQTRTAVAPYLPLTQAALPPPTNPPVPTSAPMVMPTTNPNGSAPVVAQSLPLVDQFIRGRGQVPNNLFVWDERSLGPDRIASFSYANASSLPCVGFLLMAFVNGGWQMNNGALACAPQPGGDGLAVVTFFLTSDGQAYSIVFGRVENPVVSTVAVIYSDQSTQQVAPSSGGFVMFKAGVISASVITAINAQGNTVIQNIPQVPAG